MDNSNFYAGNPVSLEGTSRSKFDLSHVWSGTGTAGKLIPFLAYSGVMPGDTFKLATNFVIRSTTPVQATMDQLYADVYYFFVRHRQVLNRASMSTATNDAQHSFEAFIGAQDMNLNMPTPAAVNLPYLEVSASSFDGSLADNLGLPKLPGGRLINIEPFECLSYWSVWNNFFRDPNTMNPVTFSVSGGKVLVYGGLYSWTGYSDIANSGLLGSLLPACRYHGYFGSALPWPQRNSVSVTLPLGDTAPVMWQVPQGQELSSLDALNLEIANSTLSQTNTDYQFAQGNSATFATANSVLLKTDLRNATAASVNEFRFAIQQQRWYEALARGGNRYPEIVEAMFGVRQHDSLSGVPEYLGGKHIALNMTQIASTAGTTTSSATQLSLGSTGAFSLTSDNDYYFTKSFDDWGTIIGVLVIRPHESFHQGVNKRFIKFSREQYYWKQYANLGEQPILRSEIYCTGAPTSDDVVFGYQEAWAEYRFLPDVVTGELRPDNTQYKYWTYCNNFGSAPTLAGYLNGDEIYKNIDQTLQVDNATAGFQFMIQAGMNITAVRPMPTYSIPGLADHH